ncbi:solute carrier family 23 member 2-like [Liolophura sinensis]|uniref:solute carrier family 23 member 2-like n=1 Tax=Liolophura sinensis TaxID=3198878 RepID=UPI0031582E7D
MENETENDAKITKSLENPAGPKAIEVKTAPVSHIVYKVADIPSFPATLVFALQVALQVVSGAVTNSILLSDAICGTSHVTAKLMSTNMFMCGLTTFIQAVIGVRLPIFQTPSIYYVVPIISRADLPDWACTNQDYVSSSNQTMSAFNGTTLSPPETGDDIWRGRLLEICGVLMIVSILHALIGATGLGGQIAKVIGPLTIAPAVVVMILKFLDTILKLVFIHLGVAVLTLATLLILTTYMANVLVPIPYWTRSHGWKMTKSKFLRTYAVLISIALGWLLCHILTVTGALPDDPDSLQYNARTDNKGDTVELAKWFYFPYPGQFGVPRFSVAIFFGLIVAMLSSVIDSLADYKIAARVCQIPKVPPHGTNRGLLIEGCCSILSGAFGAGMATSTNISVTGSLAISGVTSRRVFQAAGLLLMFLGVVGKIGAVLVIIPKPVIGAVLIVILGSVTGVLIAELNDFEMKRPRNCMTIGLAMLLGYMIPKMIIEYHEILDTGIPELNNVIRAMFGTPLFVAGVVACFLDNTLPGGRGQKPDPEDDKGQTSDETAPAHRLPYVHDYFTNCKWTRFCPFLPGFQHNVKKDVLISEPTQKLELV